MEPDNNAEILGPIARFVRGDDMVGAAGALCYSREMLAGQAAPDDVERWCYEFAAAGVPYQDWPAMACARLLEGDDSDSELRAARRDGLAEALLDHGEIETVAAWHRQQG